MGVPIWRPAVPEPADSSQRAPKRYRLSDTTSHAVNPHTRVRNRHRQRTSSVFSNTIPLVIDSDFSIPSSYPESSRPSFRESVFHPRRTSPLGSTQSADNQDSSNSHLRTWIPTQNTDLPVNSDSNLPNSNAPNNHRSTLRRRNTIYYSQRLRNRDLERANNLDPEESTVDSATSNDISGIFTIPESQNFFDGPRRDIFPSSLTILNPTFDEDNQPGNTELGDNQDAISVSSSDSEVSNDNDNSNNRISENPFRSLNLIRRVLGYPNRHLNDQQTETQDENLSDFQRRSNGARRLLDYFHGHGYLSNRNIFNNEAATNNELTDVTPTPLPVTDDNIRAQMDEVSAYRRLLGSAQSNSRLHLFGRDQNNEASTSDSNVDPISRLSDTRSILQRTRLRRRLRMANMFSPENDPSQDGNPTEERTTPLQNQIFSEEASSVRTLVVRPFNSRGIFTLSRIEQPQFSENVNSINSLIPRLISDLIHAQSYLPYDPSCTSINDPDNTQAGPESSTFDDSALSSNPAALNSSSSIPSSVPDSPRSTTSNVSSISVSSSASSLFSNGSLSSMRPFISLPPTRRVQFLEPELRAPRRRRLPNEFDNEDSESRVNRPLSSTVAIENITAPSLVTNQRITRYVEQNRQANTSQLQQDLQPENVD